MGGKSVFLGSSDCPQIRKRIFDWGKLTAPGKWNFYSYWHEMAGFMVDR
jgi:hypothetical protein